MMENRRARSLLFFQSLMPSAFDAFLRFRAVVDEARYDLYSAEDNDLGQCVDQNVRTAEYVEEDEWNCKI